MARKKTDLDRVVEFIKKNYDLQASSEKVLCINLNKIKNGNFRNISKPCPLSDLLEMWEYKYNYLQKVADTNKRMGKEIKGMALVYYDIAILLNKYDDFLKWREKNQRKQENIISQTEHIDYSRFNNVNAVNDDLSDILEEI